MQQDANQAGGEDDRASTGGVSSLHFNFFGDFKSNADTLEATEPADEGTSTLEPPSAFTWILDKLIINCLVRKDC